MQVHLSSRLEPLVNLLLSRPMSVYTSLYRFRAVHLELVSDLTTESFIVCLRRFITCRGKPTLIWSDHWTTFVGASREMKDLVQFLESQNTQINISEFCNNQSIEWNFIPKHVPHFGGVWETAINL